MKLACSSTAFDQRFASGDLTQLEWIDLCAHEIAADGVVFDVRHFPRIDTDYLAQVKKMATDVGLTVTALSHDGFFDGDDASMEHSLEIALALGAPLLAAPLPRETSLTWSEVQGRLGAATSHAKRLNITIALRNAPQTFAASTHDMKRVSKEADSAWLRYGPDFETLDAGSAPEEILARTVLVWRDLARSTSGSLQPTVGMLWGYRGFLALDDARGSATPESASAALRAWRTADQ